MASNLFEVATPVGGVPDILEGYARKKMVIDIASLKDILGSLNERQEEFPTPNSRSFPLEGFDCRVISSQLLDVYRSSC